jgi:hypothetical protein
MLPVRSGETEPKCGAAVLSVENWPPMVYDYSISSSDGSLTIGRGEFVTLYKKVSGIAPKPHAPTKDGGGDRLSLITIITDSVLTVGLRGGFMPSIFYTEYHRYITDDGFDTLVKYERGREPYYPRADREFYAHERSDIYLYMVDPNDNFLITARHTSSGEMVTDDDAGNYNTRGVRAGDTVYALANPRRPIIVSDEDSLAIKPLSAYDELKNRLMKIKDRYLDTEDADDIAIAAEDNVVDDKIIQVILAARQAGYPNITRARLLDSEPDAPPKTGGGSADAAPQGKERVKSWNYENRDKSGDVTEVVYPFVFSQ